MTLLIVLAAWILMSLPVALVVGAMIRRGQGPIPAHRIELETAAEAGRIVVPTHF